MNDGVQLVAWHPTWDYAIEHALWIRANEGWKPLVGRYKNYDAWWVARRGVPDRFASKPLPGKRA